MIDLTYIKQEESPMDDSVNLINQVPSWTGIQYPPVSSTPYPLQAMNSIPQRLPQTQHSEALTIWPTDEDIKPAINDVEDPTLTEASSETLPVVQPTLVSIDITSPISQLFCEPLPESLAAAKIKAHSILGTILSSERIHNDGDRDADNNRLIAYSIQLRCLISLCLIFRWYQTLDHNRGLTELGYMTPLVREILRLSPPSDVRDHLFQFGRIVYLLSVFFSQGDDSVAVTELLERMENTALTTTWSLQGEAVPQAQISWLYRAFNCGRAGNDSLLSETSKDSQAGYLCHDCAQRFSTPEALNSHREVQPAFEGLLIQP